MTDEGAQTPPVVKPAFWTRIVAWGEPPASIRWWQGPTPLNNTADLRLPARRLAYECERAGEFVEALDLIEAMWRAPRKLLRLSTRIWAGRREGEWNGFWVAIALGHPSALGTMLCGDICA